MSGQTWMSNGNENAPSCPSDLLKPYFPSRALPSYNAGLLSVPWVKNCRVFSYCAPFLWSKLPVDIRQSEMVLNSNFNLNLYTLTFHEYNILFYDGLYLLPVSCRQVSHSQFIHINPPDRKTWWRVCVCVYSPLWQTAVSLEHWSPEPWASDWTQFHSRCEPLPLMFLR